MKLFSSKQKNQSMENSTSNENHVTQLPSDAQERNIFSTIDENFGFLKSILGNGIGLVEGKYHILDGKVQMGVAYIESMSDKKLISNHIIEPLLRAKIDSRANLDEILMMIQSKYIFIPKMEKTDQMKRAVEGLFNGDTILFIDHINTALIIGTRKVESRSIEKPENEVTVLGSSESFTENLETNCSMIIKRLPIPDLHFESFSVGKLSHTKINLVWIEGIANQAAVEEAKNRIQKIDIDVVEGIGVLSELISDKPLSIFPKYLQTQRPDTMVKYLSDGKFGILCNNSPFSLVAPASFWDNFKTMDDYSEKAINASFLRIVRIFAFILATVSSSIYLSFVTYNQSIVPPALALTIAAGREGVPFPSILELLIMTFSIDIIREGALRIPGSVGYFVGTLAAVIIGQSAVTGGYISASLIIIVAVSAISAYAVSSVSLVYPVRLINYFLIILSGTFGMFGLINGVAFIVWYMVSLESFGVPYLYPFIPFDLEGMKDVFIRAGLSSLRGRLDLLAPYNSARVTGKASQDKSNLGGN